jgi:hypothetical protein
VGLRREHVLRVRLTDSGTECLWNGSYRIIVLANLANVLTFYVSHECTQETSYFFPYSNSLSSLATWVLSILHCLAP